MIKCFNDFINETYLENQVNVDFLNHNKKKMKKNGYCEMTVISSYDDLKKGDVVMVSATEVGQLEDESLVTCYIDDKEFFIPKKNLQVKK